MANGNSKKFDRNPQILRMYVAESAANTFTQAEVKTPVVTNLDNNKSLVMEILKVIYYNSSGALDSGDTVTAAIYDRTRTAMPSLNDPGVLLFTQQFSIGAIAAGLVVNRMPLEFDYTDQNGNGILYGKSSIFCAIVGVSQAQAMNFQAQIIYRLKYVDAQELIGIIQD